MTPELPHLPQVDGSPEQIGGNGVVGGLTHAQRQAFLWQALMRKHGRGPTVDGIYPDPVGDVQLDEDGQPIGDGDEDDGDEEELRLVA